MIFAELNASGYEHNGIFYNAEFEDILSKIIAVYQLMLLDNISVNNDENKIRDVLYRNYLNNNHVRKSIDLQYYYFDRETLEDRTTGRTDIRVLTFNSFLETEAYYIIECKRLTAANTNGKSGLNAEYISNGMCRFISGNYSAHYRTNGLIGFVVQPLNIAQNVNAINLLLKTMFKQETNTSRELEHREIVSGFDFSYCSVHNMGEVNIVLYHLMFDLSKNVSQN